MASKTRADPRGVLRATVPRDAVVAALYVHAAAAISESQRVPVESLHPDRSETDFAEDLERAGESLWPSIQVEDIGGIVRRVAVHRATFFDDDAET